MTERIKNELNGEETLTKTIEACELRFPPIKLKMDINMTKKQKVQ